MKNSDLKKYEPYVKEYQFSASEVACRYIDSESKGQCLIHIPTGAGKTGVMAMLASVSSQNTLIIVPNASLPRQIQKEITAGFWNSINIPNVPDIRVELLDAFEMIESLEEFDNTVFVSTIQFLEEHFNSPMNSNETFKKLSNNINMILFDEGHKEPATKWKEITRKLKKKTILFTATPYRNDNKVFKIDKAHQYSYTLSKAIDEGSISDLEFFSLGKDSSRCGILRTRANYNNDELLAIVRDSIEIGKIIIRSEVKKEIKHLTDYLNSNGIKTLGLHSEFQNTETTTNSGYTAVLKQANFQVFINYDILTEGINIPSTKTIIFLNTFSNFRSTAQMIGRALRKTGETKAKIYVPKSVLSEHEDQWKNMLDFNPTRGDGDSYAYANGLYKKTNRGEKIPDLKDIV